MRHAALALLLWPAAAVAEGPTPVIGGTDAPAGKWPDAAAILFTNNGIDGQACSGTLVAPTVVLTAGHCNDPTIGVLDNVLLGTNSLADPDAGETIGVTQRVSYPDWQDTIDVTVLVLARAATEAPRPIATGWAQLDIANAAPVELVGYGAIDATGTMFVNALQQAQTTITDFDCTTMDGCHAGARPDGELGAGGMGIDTCPGDSGGPLYLVTSYGAFLAGVTSRAYDNATTACSGGGIYERPDKIVDWIEQVAGVAVARGPEPAAAPIEAVAGDAGETTIAINDPIYTDHALAITTPPAQGTAAVRSIDGRVRVCADPAATGSDSLVVSITDTATPARTLAITIPIAISPGATDVACDVDAFSTDSGGCCDASRGASGSIALTFAVTLVLRRRYAVRSRQWPTRG